MRFRTLSSGRGFFANYRRRDDVVAQVAVGVPLVDELTAFGLQLDGNVDEPGCGQHQLQFGDRCGPADAGGDGLRVRTQVGREFRGQNDVGDNEPSAGPEDAVCLLEDTVLLRREVGDAGRVATPEARSTLPAASRSAGE